MRPFKQPSRHILWATAFSLCTLFLQGCGNKNAPKPTTQVAAKVGSEEISLLQVNAALANSSGHAATPEQEQAQSRRVLEDLIDQQVAVDQAIESKLNRDPDVIAQLDAARRSVLANAYVREFVTRMPTPDPQDAKKYFSEHPALFSERRIYTVQEVVVPRSPVVLQQLNTMAAANKSMDDVAAWLKTQQLLATPVTVTRAAEQIPLDLLPRMHALQDGQDLTFATPTSVTILRLLSSRTQPVPEAIALPRIAQYQSTQSTQSAVVAHIKALRSNTSVVYMGEFARPEASQSLPITGHTP